LSVLAYENIVFTMKWPRLIAVKGKMLH
jgi:hypothetical protein